MNLKRRFPFYKQAVLYLLAAAGFFFFSYYIADVYTASLDIVPSIYYSWEKYIPFLPWTIIPYWSMDLLYGLSFFICTSRKELKIHTARLMCASLFCCLFFIIFPLSCALPIPPVENSLFNYLFFGSDLVATSFNQAPSLHIALAWLVWLAFYRHTKGVVRFLFTVWFVLIGLSVFCCYQHHFIDAPTGLFAGILISYLLPLKSYKREISPDKKARKKLAFYYLAGSIILIISAFCLKNSAFLLLWPAAALIAVSLGYLHWGTSVFEKDSSGRITLSARIFLAPYRFGAYLSKIYFTGKLKPYCQLAPNLYLGYLPDNKIRQDFLIDMTAEFVSSNIKCKGIFSFPRMDLTAQSPEQIQQATQKAAALTRQGSVLICCALGLSRSVCIAAAALVLIKKINLQQALDIIKQQRPQIVLNEQHIQNLYRWYQFYIIR